MKLNSVGGDNRVTMKTPGGVTMAGSRPPSKTKSLILRHLADGDSISTISRSSKISRKSIYRHINAMISSGYLIRKKIGYRSFNYYLSQKSLAFFRGGDNGVCHNPKRVTMGFSGSQRKHGLTILCDVIDPPKDWYKNVPKILEKKQIVHETIGMNNWDKYLFVWDDVKIFTTPRSVMFQLPDFYHDNTDLAMRSLWEMFLNARRFAEDRLNIMLTAPNKDSVGRITAQHNGFIFNPIARFCLDKRLDIKVYDENDRLRLIVDNSCVEIDGKMVNLEELEMVDHRHCDDDSRNATRTIRKLFIDNDLDRVEKSLARLSEGTAFLAENMNTHIPVLKEILKTMPELRKLIMRLDSRIDQVSVRMGAGNNTLRRWFG